MLDPHDRLVVFDLETGGLDPLRHPVVQVAMIALDGSWREVDHLEVKVQFDVSKVDPEALARNSYDPEVWARLAVSEGSALQSISGFLKRHATLQKRGKNPPHRPYTIARLCGHNAARFDGEFLAAWFKRADLFCPAACYEVLDTLQLLRWFRLGVTDQDGPETLELGVVCKRLGIPLDNAHDALSDVRATAALARRLLGSMALPLPWLRVPPMQEVSNG
jgi:DNA polymerase III epsilon subunit-like protein